MFFNFLDSFRCTEAPTHLAYGKFNGKFKIPEDKHDEFMKLYMKEIKNKTELNILECQKDYSKILIDIDIKINKDEWDNERLYDDDLIRKKKFHGACQPLHRFGSGWRRLASSGHAVTWVFSCSLALCILCSLVFLCAGFYVVLLADFVAEATPELRQLCWGFLQSRADLCSFLLLSMTIFFCFMACFFFGSWIIFMRWLVVRPT